MASYGYCRVSTADQAADDRSSLEVQQRMIEMWSGSMRRPLAQVFVEEGVSGAKRFRDRPEGSRLDALLQRGDDLVVVKMDRLFRSATDALVTSDEMRERGVNLWILDMNSFEPVTTSGSARMFFGMLALVAEFERDRIRERVVVGRKEKRAKGGHTGGKRPFGYRVEGVGREAILVPVPEELAAIPRMRAMAEAGTSLRKISAAMAADGLKISHQGVKRLLEREGA